MRFLSPDALECSLSVYYPSFDAVYPQWPDLAELYLLGLGFDHVVIPGSHLAGFARHPGLQEPVLRMLREEKCVCSVRLGHESIADFYCQKVAESGRQDERTTRIYEAASLNVRLGFQRDTASQSAAFRQGLLAQLSPRENELLGGRLPSNTLHTLHRESFDALLEEPRMNAIREKVRAMERSAYFAAGARGNHSYLYDPANVAFGAGMTDIPALVVRFLRELVRRAGFTLGALARIETARIVDLANSAGCRRMRAALVARVATLHGDVENAVARLWHRHRRRMGVRSLVWAVLAGWISILDYQDFLPLKVGLMDVIAGVGGVALLIKLGESLDRLMDPMLAVALDLDRLLTAGEARACAAV